MISPGQRKREKKLHVKAFDEGMVEGASESLWMMTFADLVTVLLTFFVLLLAVSVPDDEKIRVALREIKEALVDNPEKPVVIEVGEQLKQYIQDANLSTIASVKHTNRGIQLNIAGDFSFETGKATLTENQKMLLDSIAEFIAPIPNKLEITAHTDIVPIKSDIFPSNWELSAARASGVAGYLVENLSIQGARIIAVGAGEYHPIYLPPNLPENMEKNRRVEIEILDESL